MPRRPPAVGFLVACLFVSGATALVYEVVWLRILGLVFGHTVYAITTILAAFMGGLGLGSYVFGRRAAGFANPVRTYGLLEIGIGTQRGAVERGPRPCSNGAGAGAAERRRALGRRPSRDNTQETVTIVA